MSKFLCLYISLMRYASCIEYKLVGSPLHTLAHQRHYRYATIGELFRVNSVVRDFCAIHVGFYFRVCTLSAVRRIAKTQYSQTTR